MPLLINRWNYVNLCENFKKYLEKIWMVTIIILTDIIFLIFFKFLYKIIKNYQYRVLSLLILTTIICICLVYSWPVRISRYITRQRSAGRWLLWHGGYRERFVICFLFLYLDICWNAHNLNLFFLNWFNNNFYLNGHFYFVTPWAIWDIE